MPENPIPDFGHEAMQSRRGVHRPSLYTGLAVGVLLGGSVVGTFNYVSYPQVSVFPAENIVGIGVGHRQYLLPRAQCTIPSEGQKAVPRTVYFADVEEAIRVRGVQARDSIRRETEQKVNDSIATIDRLFDSKQP